MVSKLKVFSYIGVFLLASFIGVKSYVYFTHQMSPVFELVGLEDGGHYQSNFTCNIKSNNKYKVAEMEVFLDGKPFELKASKQVGMSRFDMPFVFDTTMLVNGKHQLKIKMIDASYHANSNEKLWDFIIDNDPLKAAFLDSEYKVDQGRTVHLRINVNKELDDPKVIFLGRDYECFKESERSNIYECFIPVGCEENPGEYLVQAELKDKVGNNLELVSKVILNAYPFKKGVGFAVSQDHLKAEEDVAISDKIFESALEKWAKSSPKEKYWNGPFELPITVKRMTTPFGEIRTTAEKGRYLHRAVDLINLPRSVVWASQNGKIIIKDRFIMFGNVVVVDHGHAVHTMYCHLDDFTPGLEVGDFVKKGNPVGRLGQTGYASGYHLHWELRVNNQAVDPLQWTQRTF